MTVSTYAFPMTIRVVPMSARAEPEACSNPHHFFKRVIPARATPGEYRFRSRGPRNVPPGTLLIFQCDGKMIADARLLQVDRSPAWTPPAPGYSGRLVVDVDATRVFQRAVKRAEFMSIWPGKAPSQAWHDLDPGAFDRWLKLTEDRV